MLFPSEACGCDRAMSCAQDSRVSVHYIFSLSQVVVWSEKWCCQVFVLSLCWAVALIACAARGGGGVAGITWFRLSRHGENFGGLSIEL